MSAPAGGAGGRGDRGARSDPGGRGDRGATALELVIVVPALLAVLALLVAHGRQAQVTGLLQAAARDGARSATLSRSYPEADVRVGQVVRDTLADAPGEFLRARPGSTRSPRGRRGVTGSPGRDRAGW